MVSWGKGLCVVGRALFGGADVLGAGAAVVSRGRGGAGVVVGSTGAGTIAGAVLGAAGDGTCVMAGVLVGAADGASGGAVVTGRVGTTAPVGPTGSRDTTRTADTAMPTATTAMAPSAITAVTVPYQGSRGFVSTASETSRSPSSTVMSELLDGGGLVALGRTGYLHGENESDAAMPTAIRPIAPSATTAVTVPYQGSRGFASTASETS